VTVDEPRFPLPQEAVHAPQLSLQVAEAA